MGSQDIPLNVRLSLHLANMHSTFLPEKGTIKTLKESQTYPFFAEGIVLKASPIFLV
jgi:hypothetical protein